MKESSFEDFFKIEPEEVKIISSEQYFKRSQALLNKIGNDYYHSWVNRNLKEEEYPPESVCEKCNGCGQFKNDEGEFNECVQDKEDGSCYHRYYDAEQFGQGVESVIGELYELLQINKLNSELKVKVCDANEGE